MPKRAVFERSRRELSLDVSVGVHILLVVEQSSLESQSIVSINRGCGVPRLVMQILTVSETRPSSCTNVCCHPIYSGRQTCGRTSRGHTGFLIHLSFAVLAFIFLAKEIQPILSLVDREVEFCVYPLINRSPLVGLDFCYVLFFSVRKNPSSYDCTEVYVPRSEGFEVNVPTEPQG